jgi:UPF0755 protein
MDLFYKPRSRRSGRRSLLITLLALVAVIFFAGVWFVWQLVGSVGQGAAEFVIEEGAGVNEISRQLRGAGVINSKLVFETYLATRGFEGSIKAGTYILPAANLLNLTELLVAGPLFTGNKVTLIEGWTYERVARELSALGVIDEEVFIDLASHPVSNGFHEDNYPVLYSKPDYVDLEGYLFPDTYFLNKGVTESEIIAAMLNNLTGKLTEAMVNAMTERVLTLHEVLTMASIIEKEVADPDERRIVSGILWKRIDEGIPLQVDATVNYLTGASKPAVTYEETLIDSPFNTYRYRGLPPGPISNPGLDAIMAALYLEESPYYFYLSTPAGETIFSETGTQHSEAKAKYLR